MQPLKNSFKVIHHPMTPPGPLVSLVLHTCSILRSKIQCPLENWERLFEPGKAVCLPFTMHPHTVGSTTTIKLPEQPSQVDLRAAKSKSRQHYCPPQQFQVGPSSFRWPECPAYWSLDPSGVERLSIEDATTLRFPSILLSTGISGYSWDASVYTGLRQFHQAKGFDPDSQDVARLDYSTWC
ncbi:hypothetical protein B0H13DRAFT_2490539 [Mycena leptocephala]|nr:hypothetical protein B0H13DRAFT_2490539 [Mycena leptocephala]